MSGNKPLKGIKIIDFTHVQAGPACTQLLAWFGADVIKVERPGAGDVSRSWLRDIPDADALYFTMLNSNKRSLTLDTKTKEGKEVLEKLIKKSDVMVENFGPGALDRMGFTWEFDYRLYYRRAKQLSLTLGGEQRRTNHLITMLEQRNAASVRTCVLLDKVSRRTADIRPDYVGAVCPDEFVVGYGMDFAGRFRSLPFIGVLKPEVYEKK